jgi:hypothetical protein
MYLHKYNVCMYVCIFVYISLYLYICMRLFARARAHTHTYTQSPEVSIADLQDDSSLHSQQNVFSIECVPFSDLQDDSSLHSPVLTRTTECVLYRMCSILRYSHAQHENHLSHETKHTHRRRIHARHMGRRMHALATPLSRNKTHT